MLIRTANGTFDAIDFREKAPLSAHRDMYKAPYGNLSQSMFGGKAVGVPGELKVR